MDNKFNKKNLKTQGKNSKLKGKTQNSRKKPCLGCKTEFKDCVI